MTVLRRSLLHFAGLMPVMFMRPARATRPGSAGEYFVLDDFAGDAARRRSNVSWNGFTDRVMGGRSDIEVGLDEVAGKTCARMTGTVTRRNNGGFIQMAMYFDRGRGTFDASAYRGISLLVYGNDEDYNLHVQTEDAAWYDSSYRTTFRAGPRWTRVNVPWEAFEASNMPPVLRASAITRIGLLGWMRQFEADLSLAEIALYS